MILGRGSHNFYFRSQDTPVVIVTCVLFVALSFLKPSLRLPWNPPSRAWIWALAIAVMLALWAGTYSLMLDYRLPRDTQMVEFDMGIFASGRLVQPVAQFFRLSRWPWCPISYWMYPGTAYSCQLTCPATPS